MADGAGWALAGGQPAPGEGAPQQWGQPQPPQPAPGTGPPQAPLPAPLPPPPSDWVRPQQPEQPQRWGAPQPSGPHPNGSRQPGGPPPVAPKPGVVALRPLGVGEILDGSFSAMRANPGATLGITLAATAVVETFSTIAAIAAEESSNRVAVPLTIVSFLLNIGLVVFLTGVLSIVVSEATLGTKISVGDAARRVAPRLLGLVGLSTVVLVLTTIGLLGLVVGAIYVGVVLSLATPAYVLEGGRIRDALRRSRLLVKQAWWRTFGVLLLTSAVSGFLTLIFLLPSALIIGASPETFGDIDGNLTISGHVVTAIGNLLSVTIATPVLAGATVLIYVDRRIRREGLDVTLAETARSRAAEKHPGWE